jgi:GT2 family glycosyltransferase
VTGQPLVVCVVLSWNRREDTLSCLAAIARSTHVPTRVVVVDNASTDGTPEAVAAAFPDVDVVRNEENLGFAGGNDVGLEWALDAGADHVLVLNNDVEVGPDTIERLVDAAASLPSPGAINPKILFAEPSGHIWFAGARFDPRRGYNGHQRGYGKPDGPEYDETVETDRACGAAMFVPRAVLEEVGRFDEKLFLYSEDTDWSLRARAAGYRLYVVPEARVVHRVSASAGGESSPTTLYYGMRNTLVVCERHAPAGPLGTGRRRLVLLGAHVTQALLSGQRRAGLAAVRDGWRDARAGRLGPRPEPRSS